MPEESTKRKIEDIFAGLEVDPVQKQSPLKPEESILKPEKILEKKVESQIKFLQEKEIKKKPVETEVKKSTVKAKAPASAPSLVKSPFHIKVENILEEDLAEVYFKMPKDRQIEFQKKGEETSRKICQLLQTAKVKVGEILKLIIKWLKIIPGVNKHFLEQEVKLKIDKLLIIRDKELRK